MAASGVGLFQDDVAMDVRREYLDKLANGIEDEKAVAILVKDWQAAIKDTDDGPVFWLALAATQWEYGRLSGSVKSRAMRVIEDGTDDHRWEKSSLQKKRRAVLARLRAKLLSPLPKKRTPRRQTIPEPPSFSLDSPDGTAQATAWLTGTCPRSGLPVSQVYIIMKTKRSEGGGSVFVANCALGSIRLKWVNAGTLQISYQKKTNVEKRDSKLFFSGRTIAVTFQEYE